MLPIKSSQEEARKKYTYTVPGQVSIDFRRVRQELKNIINGMYSVIKILVMNLMYIGKGAWWWWQRKADLCELKASLVYRVSSKIGSKATEKPCPEKTKQMKNFKL